ncbi:MAG: signal peptidase I [Bacilli bacterium]|nr:signal peptidase I [Bacilli bacterium]
MKDSVKRLLVIEVLIAVIAIANFFVENILSDYKYLILLILANIFVYFNVGLKLQKRLGSKNTLQNVLIWLLMFFLVTYLTGLVIGFVRTIYSYSFTNLVKNILPTITFIVFTEVLRYQFISKSNNNKLIIILSFIAFTLLDISIGFYNYSFRISDQIYEFIGITILGSITKNLLLTIIDVRSDYISSLVYRLIMDVYIFLVPIVPNFGPYINSIILIAYPILLSFMIIRTTQKKKLSMPNEKNRNNVIYITVFTILLILVGLNSGFFKYQTLVIGSNSMKPSIVRGDVVLINKLNIKQQNILKKGDVIVFRYDGKLVAHRIYSIMERKEERFYVTKGDGNSQADNSIIEAKDVVGIVKFKIEKIGLPSIWLYDLFK